MKKVKNAMNYDYTCSPGEVNTLPSLTVPDQVLSIEEIFNRFARGSSVPVRPGNYDEDDDSPDLRSLDLAEREEYKKWAEEEIKTIRQSKIVKDDKKTEDVPEKPGSENEAS